MIKTKRICDSENCNNPHFAKGFCKFHQWKRPDHKKPEIKQAKKIKRQSDKSRLQGLIYTRKRRVFMKQPENEFCPVAYYFLKEDIQENTAQNTEWLNSIEATELHHKKGRIGKLLLHVPFWLAVSRKGHQWIHDNPKESYKKGWLIKSTSI